VGFGITGMRLAWLMGVRVFGHNASFQRDSSRPRPG
jgi:hypothetical protein